MTVSERIAISAISAATMLALSYLVGAFIAASFNIVDWGMPLRVMVAGFGVFFAAGVCVATWELSHDQ